MKIVLHDWLERYDRQLRVFGEEAQQRLSNASIMVAGLGGLGCAAALYLTAAGVGKLLLVDDERVELSNLNRQVLHWTRDVGRPKVESAAEKLRELNPYVEIEPKAVRVDESNVEALVSSVDLVIDGLDNWETRLIVNDACVKLGKPFIHAGVEGLRGQLLVVVPGRGPCLRCIVPRPLGERRPLPVLGTTAGILALMEATEAIKIVTGYAAPAVGRMILYDGLKMSFHEVEVHRRPDCPTCSGVSRDGKQLSHAIP